MSRYWILPILGLLALACSPIPTAAPKPAPAPTVAAAKPASTTVPAPAGTNYAQLSRDLVTPLSALIVATRDKSENAPMHLANFNKVADRVEPIIASDMSVNANRLSSGIKNTRTAAASKDLAQLEQVRLNLMEVR